MEDTGQGEKKRKKKPWRKGKIGSFLVFAEEENED